MPAGILKEFPQKRQNMGPSVWHQKVGLDTGDTGPSQRGPRQAGPGSWKTWVKNHDRGSSVK